MSERQCRDCGYQFRFEPEFYTSRLLAFPSRCPLCRANRRQLMLDGRIQHFNGTSGTIVTSDGRAFFVHVSDFGSDPQFAAAGAAVRFLPDLESRPTSPRARRVALVTA